MEANRQRVKTNFQIGAEYNALLEVETERAKQRMATGIKKVEPGVQNSAHPEHGKSRDKVAERIGDLSGFSAEHAGKIVTEIEKLQEGGNVDKEKAAALEKKLIKSIDGAWNLLKSWQGKASDHSKKSTDSSPNASTGNERKPAMQHHRHASTSFSITVSSWAERTRSLTRARAGVPTIFIA